MPEQQNIEYKQSWHDDYLKWICGFANAQGGIIFIGKDDKGKVVGLTDFKKLMDDIPNKIKNLMGIMAEVNLHQDAHKHFIEIITIPYSVPISLRGRYYYRSGSTKQELTGASLNEFLMKKSGKTWDDVIEQRATFDDIDEKAFSSFLKTSENKGRLPETEGLTLPEVFEKLRLSENGQLKRASIILFGKDPGKFYPNTFVKIGRFAKDDTDIRFQEVEDGNIVVLLQSVLEQLDRKFLIRPIEFEGMYRIEKREYPVPAIREMLLNALIHIKIIDTCKQADLPEPEMKELFGGFSITIFKENLTQEHLLELGLNNRQIKAVLFIKERGKLTNKDYQLLNEVTERTASRDLSDLVEKQIFINSGIKGVGSFYTLL